MLIAPQGHRLLILATLAAAVALSATAHEQTRPNRPDPVNDAASRDPDSSADTTRRPLTVQLRVDGKASAGLVRLTDVATRAPIKFADAIDRKNGWYAIGPKTVLDVPPAPLRVEAFYGIETPRIHRDLDLSQQESAEVLLDLKRLYHPKRRGIAAGNTHLHLMDMSYDAALDYLRLVPSADGLDLVFLSHLRRIPDERRYISNRIVEQSLSDGPLARLSRDGLRFRPGEEHRHNFGRGGEGFGHVMLLDIVELIRPVSIGPGIMGEGHDAVPLQQGIRAARQDGATVVWCHNALGYEDIPNRLAGVVDAQNIFDGGSGGSYEHGFYRYLNLGLRVPFSTGTDWFIYDFSRVYVPIEGEWTSREWLQDLRAGRSYITNGTFLEFQVDGKRSGDTIDLQGPRTLTVTGKAIGRNEFAALEVVHNGRVVHRASCRRDGDRYLATVELPLEVDAAGWLALRIDAHVEGPGEFKNEFDERLFAHTSPVYITLRGESMFDEDVARALLQEVRECIFEVEAKASFANEQQRAGVLHVYRAAMQHLERLIVDRGQP